MKKSQVMAERRNAFEIMFNILEEARNGINKTRLVYRTNLNFLVIQRYLDFLASRGLLQVDYKPHIIYTTTEKGLKFIETFNQLTDILGIERVIEYQSFF